MRHRNNGVLWNKEWNKSCLHRNTTFHRSGVHQLHMISLIPEQWGVLIVLKEVSKEQHPKICKEFRHVLSYATGFIVTGGLSTFFLSHKQALQEHENINGNVFPPTVLAPIASYTKFIYGLWTEHLAMFLNSLWVIQALKLPSMMPFVLFELTLVLQFSTSTATHNLGQRIYASFRVWYMISYVNCTKWVEKLPNALDMSLNACTLDLVHEANGNDAKLHWRNLMFNYSKLLLNTSFVCLDDGFKRLNELRLGWKKCSAENLRTKIRIIRTWREHVQQYWPYRFLKFIKINSLRKMSID